MCEPVCVRVCVLWDQILFRGLFFLGGGGQNAPGETVDPVVPVRKQLDRERIHGKILHNNNP